LFQLFFDAIRILLIRK